MNFEDYEKYRRLSPGQSAGGQWNVGVFSQDREERSCCAVWRCRYCRYRDASLSRLDADPAPTCSAVSYDTAADASNNNRTYLQSIYTLSTQHLHTISIKYLYTSGFQVVHHEWLEMKACPMGSTKEICPTRSDVVLR